MSGENEQMIIEEQVIATGSSAQEKRKGKQKEEKTQARKDKRKAKKAKNPNANIQISSEQGQAMKRTRDSVDLVMSDFLDLKKKKRKLQEELDDTNGKLNKMYEKFPVLLEIYKEMKDEFVKPIGGVKDKKRLRVIELKDLADQKKTKNETLSENFIKEQQKLQKEIKKEQEEYKNLQKYKDVVEIFGDNED
jgi:hypothetical protein